MKATSPPQITTSHSGIHLTVQAMTKIVVVLPGTKKDELNLETVSIRQMIAYFKYSFMQSMLYMKPKDQKFRLKSLALPVDKFECQLKNQIREPSSWGQFTLLLSIV